MKPEEITGAIEAAIKLEEKHPAEPQFDDGDHFIGHSRRRCGEHRTTGPRAWCSDCSEWCYPEEPCVRCAPEPDPARALRQAEASRRLLNLHRNGAPMCTECNRLWPCSTVRIVAGIYGIGVE